mmetsp:Transcript_8766/g.14749  ORF Transcript_8766/g.14749 Transcript_8766/m.14749 type:complete len:210 (-) Transcript_8766:457-1086(-)
MPTKTQKRTSTQLTKRTKVMTRRTTHKVHKVTRQLERSTLKTSILARRGQKEEPKINMNQMTPVVQQNIPVVPILDLQQETNHGITGERFNKVRLGVDILVGAFSKMIIKELSQRCKVGIVAFERVNRDGVGDGFNYTTTIGQRHNLVRAQPNGNLLLGQDGCHTVNQLRSQLFLSQIIIGLDEDWHETPTRVGSKDRFGAQAFLLCFP